MRNKNKPFFYDEEKTPFGRIVLIILAAAAVLILAGLQAPRIRQIIAEPLYAAGSFCLNTAKDFFEMTRMYHEEKKPAKTYPPRELPEAKVLFADTLENLSAVTEEDPLAALRQTPTPSEYSRVAEWEYLDPNLNYAISSGGKIEEDETVLRLLPPVFERADLFNDGAAILSADLRYWNITENQYRIGHAIHPDTFDPSTSFADMGGFLTNAYPAMLFIERKNGDKDILIELLRREIPVIIPVQTSLSFSYWLHDDRLDCRYILIHGYDSRTDEFFYQDTYQGNSQKTDTETLMASWYPFQRKYLAVYPEEKDNEIREALSENYYEELNLQKALSKFRTDSTMLPENPYAQVNYGIILYEDGDYQGAWDLFLKAMELKLPLRYISCCPEILQTALALGYADDLDRVIDQPMSRNSHDEVLTVYRGWAALLREEYKKASDYFNKAEKINPNSEIVLYALKYIDTMVVY